jgi:hypothetical protein
LLRGLLTLAVLTFCETLLFQTSINRAFWILREAKKCIKVGVLLPMATQKYDNTL